MDIHQDKIEILSVELLDQHRPLVNELRRLARSLNLEFGWHYLLDLAWMISHLGAVDGKHVLDAGAGIGVLQWYLAAHGAYVTSVDRASRRNLPLRFRRRFRVRGLRTGQNLDLAPSSTAFWLNFKGHASLPAVVFSQARDLLGLIHPPVPGQVVIYNQDLRQMPDIPADSLDAVVALSALEHNTLDDLKEVVASLCRLIKPGGCLLATLGAARDQDWYHTPSQGWCYTEASLRSAFGLDADIPSNYDRFDVLFEQLHDCTELRDNLAGFYFKSGDNGMPWGVWDPKYQGVGVCKIKRG